MDLPVVALECPKCGARLEVPPGLESFACAYCAASVRVRRAGGTVSLQRIEARLTEVERNTDRTASELAIVRYEKDLARVETELAAAGAANSTRVGAGCGGGLILAVLGLLALFRSQGDNHVGYLLWGLGLVAAIIGYRALQDESNVPLRTERDELRRRIAELRKLIDAVDGPPLA